MNRCANITRQDFAARLRAADGAAVRARAGASVRAARPGGGGSAAIGQPRPATSAILRAAANSWPRRRRRNVREPMAQPSSRLPASPIVRGFRTALPPREALILVAVINHPWLLEHHAEEFSELEFLNPDADHLRRAVLDAGDRRRRDRPEALRAAIAARGPDRGAGPGRGRHHPHLGLAGPGGRLGRRRGPMVDPRCYLASQAAHVK